MNMKMRARIAGLVDSAQWTKEMEAYRSILERVTKLPLPDKMLLLYVKDLDDKEKLTMALTLEFPFAKRELRKWPEMLFVKMLRMSILQANKDIVAKRRLLLSVLHTIPNLSEDNETDLTTILEEEEQQIDKDGFWAYYWTIYFHTGKDDNKELWAKETKRLSEWKLSPHHERTTPTNATNTATATADAEENKYEKKIALLESLYAKETAHRQQLEQNIAIRNKHLRMKSEELERLSIALDRQRHEVELSETKHEKMTQIQQEREHRWKQEQDAWVSERQMFLNTIRSLNSKQNQLESTIESHSKEMYFQNKDKAVLKQAISTIKDKLNDQHELINRLTLCLYQEIEEVASAQISTNDSRFSIARARIRKALDLADALEAYQAQDLQVNPTSQQESTDNQHRHAFTEKSNDAEPSHPHIPTAHVHKGNTTAPPSIRSNEEASSLNGTFYRRDHGGYIKLENNVTFNITESIVYQHGLQHEAELLCTPSKHHGASIHYDIQLLFQGDDTYSPIQQFDGYISLGDDQIWYCVDMNHAENRFHIHYKDIEIQKPSNGDPCTFNVMDGGHIARITKLYRLATGQNKGTHPAELDPTRYKQSRDKRNSALPRQKVQPFLRGSTITIIGGLRKWFEEVVLECGAELVHENGEHPERVQSDLRRSQALFLLISSTSHRATWEGIDIAKAHGIPHFVIQGSKSNLRMLLWDNRELIQSANR
ncbi:hypothetical protein [Paenibacillus sp. L3-i20]|uniref:hypothetical protein n=1 Tax=Paenibacillus sp. L3-i20 TaxID=2905833 RepID=UPI001EDEEA2D|nr:hypothetical protein [Paenibacillus sp. L3-i20]GKU79940.1 hypothetical protein L3i20_v243370 [Paenibacillus sp. L3-i20]